MLNVIELLRRLSGMTPSAIRTVRPGEAAKARNSRVTRFPFTFSALVLSLFVALPTATGQATVARLALAVLRRVEHHAVNQTRGLVVVAVLLLISVGFIADHRLAARRKRSELALQAERLRVVHLTMRTVQDIVNNSLNQLQLLRLEAEGLVPTESLTVFDRTIQDVAAHLTALGSIKTFAENQMQIGVGLDYRPNSSQQTP